MASLRPVLLVSMISCLNSSTRTTQLYNRVQEEISLDEIERIHV